MPEASRNANPTRRDFVRVAGAAGLTAAVPLVGVRSIEAAAAPRAGDGAGPRPSDPAETAVARLYRSLDPGRREALCFPSDHPLRSRVQANWAIVAPTIGAMTAEQQGLCREILRGITSEEGFGRFMRQMDEDAGGLGAYHVALFGEPGTGQPFEWVLTGRHATLRADGNSAGGGAFGGPIFYGHGARSPREGARHTGNVWWFQAERADAIFRTLDAEQRARALVDGRRDADAPRAVATAGAGATGRGILVGELDGQQKQMVRALLADLLSPFREADGRGVLACLEAAGGVDPLRLTYYADGDRGGDRTWDVWKVEGPAFAWTFHGEPHVHGWLDVSRRAPAS